MQTVSEQSSFSRVCRTISEASSSHGRARILLLTSHSFSTWPFSFTPVVCTRSLFEGVLPMARSLDEFLNDDASM
jgi:hypothetical protein